MGAKRQTIDIVILTHNRLEYFKQTIDSLRKHTRYPYRIIVVDNKSDDTFREYLTKNTRLFDTIILNERNEWTPAFQKGISHTTSDPYLVSDPDIIVPNLIGKCWLERLIDLHTTYPEMGLIALNLDPSNKPQTMPDVYVGEKAPYNEEIVLSNAGTVMQAIKRKYFDGNYITDWQVCDQIRKNGGKVGFAKNIIAYHLGWNEHTDYPEYMVEKYQYFKETYGIDAHNKLCIKNLIYPGSRTILDIGCGLGYFGEDLKQKWKAEVWGIEYSEEIARLAEKKLDKVFAGTAENTLAKLPDSYFDTIIFMHTKEQPVDILAFLKKIKIKLKPYGEIIISIPNILHWLVLETLMKENWNYRRFGIFDKAHLRYFTKNGIPELFKNAGYTIREVNPTFLKGKTISQDIIQALNKKGINTSTLESESSVYHYLIKATPISETFKR